MHRNAGFTSQDMVVLFAITGLAGVLVFIMMMVHLPHKRHGRSWTQGAPHLRRIHTGLVLYAQGNNGHYPGVMADGKTIDPAVGLTPQGRMQLLIDHRYIEPFIAQSPLDEPQPVTSFAMLQINRNADEKTITQGGRNDEWRETGNADAIIVSDRAVPIKGSYDRVQSVHTRIRYALRGWMGSVVWNDNHVTFQTTSTIRTKYGSAKHSADNLFATDSLDNGDDAFMVWNGTDRL